MLIKILVKKGGSSNKTKTLPENTHTSRKKTPSAAVSTGGYIPFIDYLTIVIAPPTVEDAHALHSAYWTSVADEEAFKKAPRSQYPSKGFRHARSIVLASVLNHKKWPVIECSYAEKKVKKLRLVLNPRKIGEQGMMELNASLTCLMDGGWQYVRRYGRISRIDVAVNIPGIRPDEFLFLPQLATASMGWSVNGHLEGASYGKGKGNQTLVYNVKKKRLAKDQSWEGKSVTRVERRLRNPSPDKIEDIATLGNPFASMILAENMPPPPPWEKGWQWSMFEDSVKVRGLTAALALLPPERRAKYRAYLKEHQKPWWDPEAIWSNWPQALKVLKLP